ncbi:MAG: primosomal protein N' [Planctomycetes bacterium]|nr:primosomal protein N' [Planctomycetota bacterium]
MVTVAPDVPVPRLFTYALPPHLAGLAPPGVRVKVPFHGRSVRGFVVEVPDEAPPGRLKEVQAVLDDAPVLREDVLALARWAADYYRSALGEVLAAAVPKSVGGAPRSRDRRGSLQRLQGPLPKRLGKAQLRAIEALTGGPRTWRSLREEGISSDVLRRLELAGLVGEAAAADRTEADEELTLTSEQTLVLGPLLRAVEGPQPQTTLLFGITGSGKTEIYLRAIARVLEQGRGAIVLVPEISLTPQTLSRFRARFGDTVAVLHSQLSGFDRRKEWWRVHQGEARVVIGPRSAVWAPIADLGLIVVDEEHEGTYKQDSNPRYHARDLAVVRGQQLGIPVLLGSATPSLESWQNAARGRYRLARMRKRPGGAKLPDVRVVDMGREWSEVRRASLLSRRLVDAIKNTLRRGERVLLFQNRRGYTTYLQCKACGYVLQCRTCDVSLTYHRKGDVCVCHFCDAHVRPPKDGCPDCLGPPLSQRGAGTERIEQIASDLFPEARVGRLDTDVVRGGETAEEVLARFASGDLNLLVGTQIIAKGLHIPEVTCVGVISADSSLALPDFRSSERTFQLIAQVAGRSGRGERPGTTIVQTFSPRHFAVLAAADHDYEAFARAELEARKSLAYPPYARLLKVLVRGPLEERVGVLADTIGAALRALPEGTLIGVLGPVPSPRAYLSNKFRYQLLIKGSPGSIRQALACVQGVKAGAGVEVVLDVDPYHLL